jgi:cytochrome b involved in lipid metabolism
MALNILIAIAMAAAIAGIVLAQKQAAVPVAGTTATSSVVTLEEVATHNTRESCWTMINGDAYDLTSWIPQHPGGEDAILQLCGTDGSAQFNGQHGGAAQQAAILAGFKIGGTDASVQDPAPSAAAPVEDDRGRNRRGRDDNE